jgi:DNA-binding IclR family transcriptional regulator
MFWGLQLSADAELAAFLREHVRSVWGVELLLLMKRDPARGWTPAELVRELRASTGLVSDNLQRFERAGLAVQDDQGCWRFSPAAAVLGQLCERLETAYRERPVAIVNLIAAPRDPLQALADAFRFKRGDGE